MRIRTTRDLGLLIRDARRTQRLTQSELATRAGVSRLWLISLENGKENAGLELIIKTLSALKLDLHVGAEVADEGGAKEIEKIITSSRNGGGFSLRHTSSD